MELAMVSVALAPVTDTSAAIVGARPHPRRLSRKKFSESGQRPISKPVRCSSKGYTGQALKQERSERHVVRALATELQATPQSNGDSSTDGWSHALAVNGPSITNGVVERESSRDSDANSADAAGGGKGRSGKPKRDARNFTPLEKLQWTTSMPEYMQSCPDELLLGDSWLYTKAGGMAPPSPSARRSLSVSDPTKDGSNGAPSKLDPYISATPAVKWGSLSAGPQYGKSEIPQMWPDPVWQRVVEEARAVAAEEPFLCTNMHGCILDHNCLEKSLAFILSNRLSNDILLPTQLMELFLDVMACDEDIRVAIREDAKAVVTRDPACQKYIHAILYMKGYHALQAYRIAHHLYKKGRHVLAYMLQSLISQKLGLDIHPAARIGHGVLMDHGMGIVIGETAVVGEMCSLMQGVTLGGTGKEGGDRHPKLGHGVLVAAHATILGNISIGTGSMIAAGSLVLKNVERRTIVAGSPARVVGKAESFCKEWEAAVGKQLSVNASFQSAQVTEDSYVRTEDGAVASVSSKSASITAQQGTVATQSGDVASIKSATVTMTTTTTTAKKGGAPVVGGLVGRLPGAAPLKKGNAVDMGADTVI
eukprot:jgi/Mesvir1/25678/Mv01887-RA.1